MNRYAKQSAMGRQRRQAAESKPDVRPLPDFHAERTIVLPHDAPET
jgi:hypothetical protein